MPKATSSPSKTLKRQTKKKAKLDTSITDEASWPCSDVPEGRTVGTYTILRVKLTLLYSKINKTRARAQYKLSDKDIKDLPYVEDK